MALISDIIKKPFVKVLSLNGISVIVRILGGLVTSKAVATYIGPSGMAIVGNLRQLLTPLEFFSTLGMQNGVVKYTAEYQKEPDKLNRMLATVFITLLSACIVLSIILYCFSGYISLWFFFGREYSWIVKVLAYSLPWYAGSLILISILNGLGSYQRVISINIAGNILGVLLSVILMWKYQTDGALLGTVFFQAFIFIFSFYTLSGKFALLSFFKPENFDVKMLLNLASYSIMTLVPALLLPVIYVGIKNKLAADYGLDIAGFYEAINRISSFYMMFATMMITVYFFPKLSSASIVSDTRNIIWTYYKSMLPLFAVGFAVLYFLRVFTVLIILKKDFLPITDLFFWQMLGDFFKIGSMILGYQFFAKRLTTAYILTELLSFGMLYFASDFLIDI